LKNYSAGGRRRSGFVRRCALIESLGPVTITVSKSQVAFGAKYKFAWVWPPQVWSNKRPPDSIVLTFGLGRQIVHSKIVQSVEPRPGRWTHHVMIEQEADLDVEVRGWLAEAYTFGQRGGRSRYRPAVNMTESS
jgi:hypothetical protein